MAETRDAALIGAEFARDRVRDGTVEELDVTSVKEATRHLTAADSSPDPAGAVARLFAIDVPTPAREALLASVAGTDAVAAEAGDTVLLGGPVSTLLELTKTVTEPAALVDALDGVREGCR